MASDGLIFLAHSVKACKCNSSAPPAPENLWDKRSLQRPTPESWRDWLCGLLMDKANARHSGNYINLNWITTSLGIMAICE